VQWAKFTKTIKLGCISAYMGRHLVKEHGASADCLVPTMNGIDLSDPQFAIMPQAKREAVLRQYKVPMDRPLCFSWGRFVPEKGFDIVLDATLRTRGVLHPVVVGMVDHSPDYPGEIVEWAKSLKGEHTIIVERNWELVTAILQHPNTKLAAILSRYDEPHGLVVNEARYHARQGGPVVMVSDRGGLPEQVTHGTDGLIADIDGPDATARMMCEFMARGEAEHARMRTAALETLRTRYSFENNIIETLCKTIPLPGVKP
jgi:glycosyltransferase involved in cell wall biosynthesis